MHRLRPDKLHKMHRNSFPIVAPTTTVGRSSSSAATGATVTLEIEASRNEICSPLLALVHNQLTKGIW